MRFQSHLGSIAALYSQRMPGTKSRLSIPPWFDCGQQGRQNLGWEAAAFNPTLVRLRQSSLAKDPLVRTSFNPTLVRLRPDDFDDSDYEEIEDLSIPPWFDCGAQLVKATLRLIENIFQSHLGSIAACLSLNALFHAGCSSFNPTLVRLRLVEGDAALPQQLQQLSIPPWFDCGHGPGGPEGAG